MKNNRYYLMALIFLFGLQSACVKKADQLPQPAANSRPLLTILKNNYTFSMFYSALQRTGLDKTLEGKGPYTLLAPDNDAFTNSGISADSLAKIDTGTLKKLLSYHIIPASLPYDAIPQAVDITYKTLAGSVVYFSVPIQGPAGQQTQDPTIKTVHINGVTVNKVDISASNGTIYDLAKVLTLPAASVKAYLQGNPQYSLFIQALKQFGLFDQLDKPGPFVVMAPSNDVFAQNGIDQAALAKLDTLHYKKFLFSPYVLTPNFFFLTDMLDAPLSFTSAPGIITPNFILVPANSPYAPASYAIMPFNYLAIEQYTVPPYDGNPYVYGPPASFTDPDHLAVNGIVHGISGLVMSQDTARIH